MASFTFGLQRRAGITPSHRTPPNPTCTDPTPRASTQSNPTRHNPTQPDPTPTPPRPSPTQLRDPPPPHNSSTLRRLSWPFEPRSSCGRAVPQRSCERVRQPSSPVQPAWLTSQGVAVRTPSPLSQRGGSSPTNCCATSPIRPLRPRPGGFSPPTMWMAHPRHQMCLHRRRDTPVCSLDPV